MTAGQQIAGAAIYGRLRRRRRRPVVAPPQPVPTVCEACLTDTEVGVCPDDCPSRGVGR